MIAPSKSILKKELETDFKTKIEFLPSNMPKIYMEH